MHQSRPAATDQWSEHQRWCPGGVEYDAPRGLQWPRSFPRYTSLDVKIHPWSASGHWRGRLQPGKADLRSVPCGHVKGHVPGTRDLLGTRHPPDLKKGRYEYIVLESDPGLLIWSDSNVGTIAVLREREASRSGHARFGCPFPTRNVLMHSTIQLNYLIYPTPMLYLCSQTVGHAPYGIVTFRAPSIQGRITLPLCLWQGSVTLTYYV